MNHLDYQRDTHDRALLLLTVAIQDYSHSDFPQILDFTLERLFKELNSKGLGSLQKLKTLVSGKPYFWALKKWVAGGNY